MNIIDYIALSQILSIMKMSWEMDKLYKNKIGNLKYKLSGEDNG